MSGAGERQDPHVARVGVLGGGQLARMLALAGAPLGVRLIQLTPDPDALNDVTETIHGGYTDHEALRTLAHRADVVTYETENVPPEAVAFLDGLVPLLPPPRALGIAADRWAEKELFDRLDIPTARYARVAAAADLEHALRSIGLPAVVKTRRLGYDGRGQLVCRSEDELRSAWQRLGEVPLICEEWIGFDRELSVVAVRGGSGVVQCYAPVENLHEAGILRTTIAPAPDLPRQVRTLAESYVRRIVEEKDYVGVLALEMFQLGDSLLANEIAPRVHNTGHWTIEGAATSQFENHLRAVLGWPLGSTAERSHAVMVNIIGAMPPLEELLAEPGVHVHLYGKQPRPGRKIGHVTALATTAAEARERAVSLRRLIEA